MKRKKKTHGVVRICHIYRRPVLETSMRWWHLKLQYLIVWKFNRQKDPLGFGLFPNRKVMRPTRIINRNKVIQLVNLMTRSWNPVTELQTVSTLGAAKSVAQKLARNLLIP